MFGLGKTRDGHPGEIPLAQVHPDLPADAFEVGRFWLNSERSFVSISFRMDWSPELLGSLMVEGLHSAAEAYSRATSMPEAEALRLLWKGLDKERERIANNSSEDIH